MNLSARIGEEEFLSTPPNPTAEGTVAFAERVRRALPDADTGDLPISAGVAEFTPARCFAEEVLENANRPLCRAKAEGRACTRVGTAR